jgi:hypothetical protein
MIRRLIARSGCVVLSLAAALSLMTIPATPAAASADASWQRSMLVYHRPDRDDDAWKRHLMRVSDTGEFTGQWLFDAAVLTARTVNGKDLMTGGLTNEDLDLVLDQAFADAARLDRAASALAGQFGKPAAPIKVSITVPWIGPNDQPDRMAATNRYLDQIRSRAEAASWQHLRLYGAYYHREDASGTTGEAAYVRRFNEAAHARGLSTVWVPYYDAPNAWHGKNLGFDVVNVQPSYAFRSAQYEGHVDGGRLYAVGAQSASQGQAYEYEVSGLGETRPESWNAHQYLAISQATGASAHPQVFFAGLEEDLFDRTTNRDSAVGERWWTYTDLANYLRGDSIRNLEIGLPWSPTAMPDGSLRQVWIPTPEQSLDPVRLNSVRLDFADADPANPWKGRLTVQVNGAGGTYTVFGQRAGANDLPGYHSVRVPLPVTTTEINSLTITMTREPDTPWPTVHRLVAARYEQPAVGNGAAGETTSTVRPVQAGPYADSAPTDRKYAAGKLTDGAVSPTGTWSWDGSVGWNFYDGRFSVSISLDQPRPISRVELVTHSDQAAGMNWPHQVAAAIATKCAPRENGIPAHTVEAVGTSGQATLSTKPVEGSPSEKSGTVSLPVGAVTGRCVTVTGAASGWLLIDEVRVKDDTGAVISTGRPYTISPTPSIEQGDRIPYGDDSNKLADGAIAADFLPHFGQMFAGIPSDTGGNAEITWTEPRAVTAATIWMAKPNDAFGVKLPSEITIQWRDEAYQWRNGVPVTPSTSGEPSPYAKLAPVGTDVTGIRATFPAGSPGWYMLSEISTQ